MKKNMFKIVCTAVLVVLASTSCKFVSIKNTKGLEGLKEIAVSEESSAVTDTRVYNDISGFNVIISEGAYDISYSNGPERVEVSAPENILSHLVVKASENGELLLTSDGTKIKNWKNVKVNISSPELKGLDIRGAVDFDSQSIKTEGDFKVTVSGAADVQIDNLEAENIEVVINGAGEMNLNGINCRKVMVEVNGAGDIKLKGDAQKADLTINGAGSVNIKNLNCPDIHTNRNGIGAFSK